VHAMGEQGSGVLKGGMEEERAGAQHALIQTHTQTYGVELGWGGGGGGGGGEEGDKKNKMNALTLKRRMACDTLAHEYVTVMMHCDDTLECTRAQA
jgi:hypothetical protein